VLLERNTRRVHDLAMHVDLDLTVGAVADAHWLRALVPGSQSALVHEYGIEPFCISRIRRSWGGGERGGRDNEGGGTIVG
jgi:hypothetical protein